MEESKKITFILGSMGRGGAEKVISVLSKDYAYRGWKTDIIVLLNNKVVYDLNPTTRIIDFSGNTQSRIRRVPYWIKSIRKYVKENQPDVVLSFSARINILTQVACNRKYVGKIFVSERNDPRYDGRTKIVDIATKFMYSKADAVIFQTKRAKDYFPKLKNGIVLPNTIEIKAVSNSNKKKKVVSVGCLKTQKNHRLLIEAFSDVIDLFPDYQLYIYGEGPLRENLEKQIQNMGLVNSVFLPGAKSNVHEHIADAELFVLPSNYEGLSNALLEALMMGLPCISTDCAGADEYINGSNGLIVPVHNRKALADAMCKMLSDDEYRKKCGKNARIVAQEFNPKRILEMWHDLLG